MRLDDHDVTLGVAAHPLGFAFVSLRHLPETGKHAIARKLLHTRSHIDYEQIVIRVQGDGTRLIKLAWSRAPTANDLDVTEHLAV
jgi:hypothetical protein